MKFVEMRLVQYVEVHGEIQRSLLIDAEYISNSNSIFKLFCKMCLFSFLWLVFYFHLLSNHVTLKK